MTFTPETATVDQHAVREVAMAVLRGPPDPDATSPAAWCARAGVDPDTWAAWVADGGEAFRAWFFAEIDPVAPFARRARGVRFWAAMDRALDAPTPNASVLKLHAEIHGLVGRGVVPFPDADGTEDDESAWGLIADLPPEVLHTLATNADARERARVTRGGVPAPEPTTDTDEDPEGA